ncbi:MAG: efflux RND transporter periplasmic adaptor subunit [Candidatus Symbiodolus clandestinus]
MPPTHLLTQSNKTTGLILVGLLLIISGFGWQRWRKSSPVLGPTITVERQDLLRTLLATGKLEAINQVEVGTQVSGQLQQITVKLGDYVKQDQLLATLDAVDAKHQVAISRAKLAAAVAEQQQATIQLKLAQQKQQRLKQLVHRQASEPQKLDEANAELARQQAECGRAAAQTKQQHLELQQRQHQLTQMQVTAPCAGQVVSIPVKVGQTVVSSQAASTLLILADLHRMKVRTLVSEADIIHLSPGLAAEFTLLGDSQRCFSGTILSIECLPESTNEGIFYPVIFEVDNPDGLLRPAMTAQVMITLERLDKVLTIPYSALDYKDHDNSYYVQTLVNGKPQARKVTLGARNNFVVQVVDGVSAGDQLLLRELPKHAH